MDKFKVGDRVRIVCAGSPRDGCTGTIWNIQPDGIWLMPSGWNGQAAYRIDVDGVGKRVDGLNIAYPAECLRPLINPDEQAWQAFKSLHLKPDPALILAKEAA